MFPRLRMLVVIRSLALTWMAGAVLLSGCANPAAGTRVDQVSASVTAVITMTRLPSPTTSHTPSPTPSLTITPTLTLTVTPSPTMTLTPEPLAMFNTSLLRPGVIPLSYLSDTCTYLERRWAVDSSKPGTVVVPVMFHSIYQNSRNVPDPKDISAAEFQGFVQAAQYLGFETITTIQLLGFLSHNDPIPERSMILILDDRRPGVVRDNFMPVLEANDWTLTLAYIADPNSMGWAMEEIERLYQSGRLDVQSHGYGGALYIVEETSDEEIQNEIWNSTPVLAEHFGVSPLAFIWPGGNFTARAVKIARQGDYQLGFTAYSRGPVLFNWVPQGESEQAIGDPLMLLPRAWSNSAAFNLSEAVEVGELAREQAQEVYASEAAYFQTYCGGELPKAEAILGESP